MLRNTYRKVRYADDGLIEFQCLECYSKFYWCDYGDFKFCPFCGTRLTQMTIFKEKNHTPYVEPPINWIIEYDNGRKHELNNQHCAREVLDSARYYSREYGPTRIYCGNKTSCSGRFIEIDEKAKEYARWHPIAKVIGFNKDPRSSYDSWIRIRSDEKYDYDDWEYFDHYGKFRDFLIEYGTPEEIEIHNKMLPENPIL